MKLPSATDIFLALFVGLIFGLAIWAAFEIIR